MSTERKGQHKAYSTKSPERLWDYIIIGSGMGGLTTAALLSEVGHRVLVLEQHYVPGGFTHTFKRKKWVWDVGVHAVGEVDQHSLLGRVLHTATRGKLEWSSLGGVYDEFFFPDLRIDFPDNRKQFEENLREAFPHRTEELRTYLQTTREVSSAMKSYYLARLLPPGWAPLGESLLARKAHNLLTQTTRSVLDTITTDPRLQSVLTAQWGYYGSPPERSSFAVHALVARHFLHGGFYPVGGAGSIADAYTQTIERAGGWTRINTTVQEISIRDAQAVGVRLDTGEYLPARNVISAAGALPTVQNLLPEAERSSPWVRSIETLVPSPCHVCLYLGFKGDPRTAGAGPANKWFYETWASDALYWDVADPKSIAPVLYCSFPSLKDPQHDPGPEQLHTGEIVTFVPYEVFAPWRDGRWRKRGEDYDALKQQLTERLLEQFYQHMPGLKPLVAYAELSTPLSTEYFTRAAKGAIYGLEPTPARYQNPYLRPRTPVRNLYLSGADLATVGVMGAFVGGVLSAAAADPTRVLPYLRSAAKR